MDALSIIMRWKIIKDSYPKGRYLTHLVTFSGTGNILCFILPPVLCIAVERRYENKFSRSKKPNGYN